jgi:hypothetical protein
MSGRIAALICLEILAVILASMLCTVSADALSGKELVEQCLTNKQSIVGYIAGASDKASVDSDILFRFYLDTYDVMKTAERIERDNQTLTRSSLALDGYCIPEAATPEQRANVYCKYLADNPEQRNRSGAELWVTAAKAAWPCQ